VAALEFLAKAQMALEVFITAPVAKQEVLEVLEEPLVATRLVAHMVEDQVSKAKALAQFVLSGPVTLVAFHQLVREICNA
jgi:hypothetical protein